MRSVLLAAAVAALALVPTAAGDAVYHSQHIGLSPVATDETGTGFVENIHANGPNVYAHEQYALKGALPSTDYVVWIHVSAPADDTCAVPILEAPTATFTTNPAGNGAAYHVFTPADIGALRGSTVHVYWTVTAGGSPAYATACQTIQLD
ncbi:MAG TPA: hypothetical protein VLD13_08010 [Gaiellaceae bacterium]|nr:hypothetical protein [Gaiellaceae bacterium]